MTSFTSTKSSGGGSSSSTPTVEGFKPYKGIDSPGSATDHSGLILVNRDEAIVNSSIVTHLGFYHTSAITVTLSILKRNSAGSYTVIVDQSLSHGGTGWEYLTLTSPVVIPATGDYYVGYHYVSGSSIPFGSANRGHYITAGMISGTQTGFTEDSGNTGGTAYKVQATLSIIELACVIRNSGSGWGLIDDDDHFPLNIQSVSNDTSAITITYGDTYTAVGTFVVTPDETYAVDGIFCGASVGLSSATLTLSNGTTALDPNTVSNASGNLWVYGKMYL